MKCALFFNFCNFFYMVPNYLYSRFLAFVQALHFYFSVVISIHLILSLKQICYVTALITVS